ncbi:MAG: hypothetical protein M3Y24_07320 [Acidobacteriota bacterium]|nr:hypothetical protein [Acidobacteriota bacterium]
MLACATTLGKAAIPVLSILTTDRFISLFHPQLQQWTEHFGISAAATKLNGSFSVPGIEDINPEAVKILHVPRHDGQIVLNSCCAIKPSAVLRGIPLN